MNSETILDAQFRRHRGPVTCAAAIPNTGLIITSAYDGAVALFNTVDSGVELLGYHRHLANRIRVNSSGTRAASSSSDYSIAIWNLTEKRLERTLHGHSDDVEDFAFIDDTTGVSVSRDCRVIIWCLATGAIKRIIEEHEKDVLSVEYHAGRIVTSGDDMTMRVWDSESGHLLRMWGPFETEVDTCAIDPMHNRAVLGCDDGVIRIFDLDSGDSVAEIKAHASAIKKVAVSPENGDILSAAYDQKIAVWHAKDFNEKVVLEPKPATWERSLNWAPDGATILAGTFDGTVLVWNSRDGQLQGEYGEAGIGNVCINDIAADAHGRLAVVSDDGYIRLGRLDRDTAQWTAKVEPASGRMLMNAVTLDSNLAILAAGAHNQKLHLFELEGNTLVHGKELRLNEGPINCIRIARIEGYQGQSFTACYSGTIARTNREGGVLGRIRLHEGAVKALRLHPTEPIGVSCSADGVLLSWDFAGSLYRRYPGHMAIVDDLSISPDGSKIASVSRDFTLKVFDLHSGLLLHSLPLGRRSPKAVHFYSNSTVIVTNYWGALLRADLNSGTILKRTIAENGISSIHPSGEYLVVGSYDGAAYLVNPADLAVLNVLRAMQQKVAPSLMA